MYITKIDSEKPGRNDIEKAVQVLADGDLVVFPTETAYGLACDSTDTVAVKRVFKAKNRSVSKPLSIIVSSFVMARKYGSFGALSKGLAKTFWPGPLTIVVPAVPGMPKGVVNNDDYVAMRVSSHPVATALSRQLGKPIVATSANWSGQPEHYDVGGVIKDLGNVEMILDAGKLKKRKPSTIVRCEEDICRILREGSVGSARLARALKKCAR